MTQKVQKTRLSKSDYYWISNVHLALVNLNDLVVKGLSQFQTIMLL